MECDYPDSKVYGANMGPTWGRQDPDGPHVGPMNLTIWVAPQKFKGTFIFMHIFHYWSAKMAVFVILNYLILSLTKYGITEIGHPQS